MPAQSPNSIKPLLFVYGTLMSRADHPMAKHLSANATKIGPATYQGKMYLLSFPDGNMTYPGVTPSSSPSDLIHGEIYELHSHYIFNLLDEYEGCTKHSPQPHEYSRELVEVFLTPNQPTKAWIYLYTRPTDDLPQIESGMFQTNA